MGGDQAVEKITSGSWVSFVKESFGMVTTSIMEIV